MSRIDLDQLARNIQERLLPTEIRWTAVRSSGPGGQNVNKLSTKVLLQFNVRKSTVLSHEEKSCIEAALASRISRSGVLRVESSAHRSQLANKQDAVRRLCRLLAKALIPKTPRVPTKPSAAQRKRRLAEKAWKAEKKQSRSLPRHLGAD